MPAQTGITAQTVKRIIVDAGAVYRNHGEATGMEKIGATRGGATFTVERETREIEVDGTKGPVMGMVRTIRHTARLEFTLVEVSKKTWLELTFGTATPRDVDPVTGEVEVAATTGSHVEIIPSNDITLSNYLKNVALVGDVMNSSVPVIIKILNALTSGEWSITTDDQDEGTLSVTYTGTYDPAAMNTPPYQILWPVSADTV